jgi:hypothetical protein
MVRPAIALGTQIRSSMTRLARLAPLLLLGLLACDQTSRAPTRKEKAAAQMRQAIDRGNVEADAARVFDALYRWGDVDALLEHCHPQLIQASGGKDGARRAFEHLVGEVQSSGIKIESFAIPGSTELVSTDYSDFAIVPTRGIFRLPGGGRVASWSFQLAVRKPGEKDWGFVDGSRLNEDNLWVLFPDFPKTVRLPRCVETTLEESATTRQATASPSGSLR